MIKHEGFKGDIKSYDEFAILRAIPFEDWRQKLKMCGGGAFAKNRMWGSGVWRKKYDGGGFGEKNMTGGGNFSEVILVFPYKYTYIKIKYDWGIREKNKMYGGRRPRKKIKCVAGVRDFFQSVPPEDCMVWYCFIFFSS